MKAWQLYAVMDGDKCVKVVAKNPDEPSVIDVTADIAELIAANGHTATETAPP